jgi:aminocarboxymuconate-semialdehyde decarboxylase
MEQDCCAAHALPRRRLLQGGLAAAAIGAAGARPVAARAAAAAEGTAARAIDIHAHYYPQAYLDVLAVEGKRYGYDYEKLGAGFAIGPVHYAQKFTDLDQRLAEMDEIGVEMHALSLTAPMVYFAEPEAQERLARAWNDAASAAHQAHPRRFVALATLPMGDPDRALAELLRASALKGVRGVYLGTNVAGRDLDDPSFTPVFARIEALGLPVFLHPTNTVGGERLGKSYYLSNLIGNPLDTAIAAAHLIFGGVLDRFPKLEIALPHSGGVMPILMGRWDHAHRVRPEVKQLPAPPSAYLRRFTYDTVCHSEAVLKFLIDQVGLERVMLGSDYCFEMGYARPVDVVDGLGLDAEQRAQVLRGTAAKLLKV